MIPGRQILRMSVACAAVPAVLATLSTAQSTGEYSNLGGGLLGHVLALRTGMSYEALVESRITRPLGIAAKTFARGVGRSPTSSASI